MRKLWPLAVLATTALVGAGCSSGSAENGSTGTGTTVREKGMKFAACMRDNGVSGFPDPDRSGELTIDGVANGSSVDTSTAAFTQAIGACEDLQPPGFTGRKATPKEMTTRLAFAQCMRDNGVKDFPDPTSDEPLVDTNRIPSSSGPGGMSALNAAMRKCGAVYAGELGLKGQ